MSLSFEQQPQDHWVTELVDRDCKEKEESVSLTCRYSKASVKLHWLKNKLEIFQGQKYKFINNDGEFRLVVHRIGMEDAGKYTCSADDKMTSCWLTVEGMSPNHSFI